MIVRADRTVGGHGFEKKNDSARYIAVVVESIEDTVENAERIEQCPIVGAAAEKPHGTTF